MFIDSITSNCFRVLSLTPVERLNAISGLDGGSVTKTWLITAGISLVVILVGVLAIYFVRRIIKLKSSSTDDANFKEQASRRGLSDREQKLLMYAAKLAGLDQIQTIFTMHRAFDLGVNLLLEQVKIARYGG